MFSSIVSALVIVAVTAAVGYKVSSAFWSTEYARTNTSGDFGSPRGGLFATCAGIVVGMMFTAWVGRYFIEGWLLGPLFLVVMVVGAVAGFVPSFRRRTDKHDGR